MHRITLTYLTSLYLYDNALTGSLPVSFSKLSQLVNLEAYDNLLTGKKDNIKHLLNTKNFKF